METLKIPDHFLNEYQIRPVTQEDAEATVETINAFSRSQIGVDQTTVEQIRADWRLPLLDPQKCTIAVFTPDQQVAGYMEFYDFGAPHVRLIGWGVVHPDHWGRGIGGVLTDWLIQRAQQNIPLAPDDTRIVLHNYVYSHNEQAAQLLTQSGFQDIRRSYIMKIDFTQPPAAPMPLDGIVIRSISGEAEKRAAMLASYEAFKDHWGHVDEDIENYIKRFNEFLRDDPFHDPSLWFIALDGNEIAGVSLCSSGTHEDPDMGWVGTLGVRRDWRKRGIGLALLQHSFYKLHELGRKSAGLSVDASSLTGATRLYERAGMHVLIQKTLFEMELRAGKDLMTQNISA